MYQIGGLLRLLANSFAKRNRKNEGGKRRVGWNLTRRNIGLHETGIPLQQMSPWDYLYISLKLAGILLQLSHNGEIQQKAISVPEIQKQIPCNGQKIVRFYFMRLLDLWLLTSNAHLFMPLPCQRAIYHDGMPLTKPGFVAQHFL